MRTRKVGEYEVCRQGRSFRLWQVETANENAYTAQPTDKCFDTFNEAIIAAYALNNWGFPRWINA